jgi:methylphosphotriester-DNA--protein-cysteine methyltransferase
MSNRNIYLASKPRYEILDGLRGVAAMLVVAFHLFETYFHMSPDAAIDLVHLLKDKSLSLTDIAYMFDFSSQSHFSRFVQNNLGQKPSAFRT